MRTTVLGVLAGMGLAIMGCERPDETGPPTVRLGEDVCAECNMIISDRRWATATILQGPRGPEARLFDDYNCQVNYENAHGGETIMARWSHDHGGGGWLPTENATFLISDTLRTPMGSRMAAFSDANGARAAGATTPGDVAPFDEAWKRLGHAVLLEEHKNGTADAPGADAPPG